jgi:hypothetical protein
MIENLTSLSPAEMMDVNGGEVNTRTSFAYDVANWVGTAAAFYAGMWDGFWGN